MQSFASLPIGETFDHGGNLWRKRSSRTAEITMSRSHNPDAQRWAIHTDHSGTWAYFNQRETVNQERHWWDAMQYGLTLAA